MLKTLKHDHHILNNTNMTLQSSLLGESWLTKLKDCYAGQFRFYHTYSHIHYMLNLFQTHKHLIDDALAVELAIYFHE